MADFSLQDLWWLKPQQPDNPLPALQLGVNIAQRRAAIDLKERDLANDIARTSLMREEQIYKQRIQTQLTAGNAKMAEAIAGVDDWTDEEQVGKVWETGAQYPMTVGGKAWIGAQHMHENAKTAQRLTAESQSRIDERNRLAAMAGNAGWVYPEDGSPPYLVDAKGGTHFAPFHAGLDAGFTPEKTNVGGVDLIHVSPNKWQVVNRPPPEGKMTDIEREDLRFVRRRRQEVVDSLPTDIPKTGLFGGNKDEVEKYRSKTNEIATLTAKEEAIHKAVTGRAASPTASKVTREGVRTEDRSTNAPPAVAAPTGKVRVISPNGTPGFIPESQLEEALKAGYTRP